MKWNLILGINDLGLFVVAGFLLNITPGPDMALIVARSTRQGARAGIAAALGVGAGAFVHIAAAALGVSALVLASATAFSLLKWAGAVYLVWLGVRLIMSSFEAPTNADAVANLPRAGLWQIFIQGVLTNALNPKVAVFFLAFLPQFVDHAAASKAVAFIALGILFDAVGTAWNIVVACLAARFSTSSAGARARIWLERAVGVLFVGFGLRLALAQRT